MSNNTKRIYIIIIWVITLIVIIFGIYRFIDAGSFNLFSFGDSNMVTKTEAISADITELDIDVDSANVIFEEGDTPSITYTFPEKSEVNLTNDGSKVMFKENNNKSNVIIFGSGKKKEVKVTLPRDRQLVRINTKTDSGNLEINNVKCDDIITNLDSGNFHVNNVAARNLKAEADSGNIVVNSNIENMNVEVDSGNVEVNGTVEKIDAKADSGNIELKGDLHIINAKADTGNITIDSKKPESEMVLNLEIDLGKITVNGNKYKN